MVCFVHFQGANASALEKEIGSEQFPVNEHYFGLVNVSVNDALCRLSVFYLCVHLTDTNWTAFHM